MAKYKSAFIIRTPYHYINALEAASRYEVDTTESILIVWSYHFKERFSHIVEKEKWKKIVYIPVVRFDADANSWYKTIKNVSKDLRYLVQANVFSVKTGKVNMCFSIVPTAKYLQHVINKMNPQKLVIIDEGVGCFELTNKYLDKRSRNVKKRIFRFDRRRNNNIEFFTSYPLEEYVKGVKQYDIKRHSFEVLRSKVGNKKCMSEGGLILGSIHNKAENEVYTDFLNESVNFMKKKNNNIWYKPHRMEAKGQIEKVTRKHGVRLINNNLPIEIALIKKKLSQIMFVASRLPQFTV